MIARSDTVLDEYQRPVPGALVYVYNIDGTAASLTSDGVTTLVQPIVTDEFGGYSYQANVGYYREDIWFGGKLRYQQNNIAIGSPGADLALRSDLASTTDATKGAALSAFNSSLTYTAGSVGAFLNSLLASAGSALVGFLQAGTGAVARTVQAKLRDMPFVEDFGAVGDGVTDDTTAIQNALNACSNVRFKVGKTYKTTATLTVPTTCYRIEGVGAYLQGPGSGGVVDGFYFTGFNQGPSTFPTWHRAFRSRHYRLPGMFDFRRGVWLYNAAFLSVECDLVGFCIDGVRIESSTGANSWAVQNIVKVELAQQCTNAVTLATVSGSVEGIQGCTIDIRYVSGCNVGINGTFDAITDNINYNIFRIGNLDGHGVQAGNIYAVDFAFELTGSINTFLFENAPINMNPAAGNTPYINVDKQEVVISGPYAGGDFAAYHFDGFLPGGFRTTAKPANGTMTVHVDQSVAVTGNGSSGAPFKTIAEAVAAIQKMDGMGNTALIQLAAGTYTETVLIDAKDKGNGNWKFLLAGVLNTPASVILTGLITVQGSIHCALQDLTVQTNGIVANYHSSVELTRVNFGASTGQTHLSSANYSTIDIQTAYTISGGAAAHYNASTGGRIRCLAQTVTVSGTPAFSVEFALATDAGSQITLTGSTFTGSATGVRYLAQLNAVINTNGGGATFLPGGTAGSVANGGVYA